MSAGMFEGKTVIVSGVGPGLGRETALVIAREGGNLVIAARSEDKLNAVAADVEALEANHAALRDYRRRANGLDPPKEYEDQHEAFEFALGDLHYAAELAHRLAADPVSATQSDFDAYALHADRAAEHLRRSNKALGRGFETIEDARMPTIG